MRTPTSVKVIEMHLHIHKGAVSDKRVNNKH